MANDESELFSRGYTKDTLGWVEFPTKLTEAIQGFFQISYELVLALGLDNDIIDISFNIAM